MSRRNKIIYWVATLWLALGMVSTGLVQVMGMEAETAFILKLGYPKYLLVFLGATKLLGVVALLIPRYPLLKEWAYAGVVFTMAGAIYSHVAMQAYSELFPPLLLLALSGISWYFRPADCKVPVVG